MSPSRRTRTLAVVLAGALVLSVGCARTGPESSRGSDEGSSSGSGGNTSATKADFGSLKNVCQPGNASGDTATGIKDGTIQLGTATDFGFTQNREFIDAAEAFTQWCNDAGGINGRKIAFKARDAKLFEYRQRILESCREDFALVGGGAAFDGSGVKDRLKCMMPEIPGQVVSLEAGGSDLQVDPFGFNRSIYPYTGYFRWLTKEAHPESLDHVGIITGDVGTTKLLAAQAKESLESIGAKIVYDEVYPATGVSDWTPYAQAIKSNGVKGLVFFGDFKQLAKLEQALTDIGYQLSWVDANSNSYNKQFIELTGANLDKMPNYADGGVYPLEKASANPASQQLIDIFKKYKPEADITKPVVNAFSAWLLFATSASQCGAELTRKCLYEKATQVTDWDGAGLHQPTNLKDAKTSTEVCFTVEKASAQGWAPAEFKANEGAYRCENETNTLKGNYPKPATLADVNKTMADLK
jgi:ABC-type branched-subunit amino acid transport system substrate-binding protein